jgi:hypothetical protein
MFEHKSGVLLIAGVMFFALAFVSNAVVPAVMYADLPEKTAEELVNPNIRFQFEELARRFPEPFKKAFGEPPQSGTDEEKDAWWNQKVADALRTGLKVYKGEACWHCHSQFIRPVANEEVRWGPVAKSEEYANELQRPVLFGTRRVGPDLSRAGGRHSNDWHTVHFRRPTDIVPNSPMPQYPWFFEDGDSEKPNKKGLSIITYIQWQGSWLEEYPYYEDYKPSPLPDRQALVSAPIEGKAAPAAASLETKPAATEDSVPVARAGSSLPPLGEPAVTAEEE